MSTIIWSCIFVLTLAYPALYSLTISPQSLFYSILYDRSKNFESVSFLNHDDNSLSDVTLKTFSINYNDTNLLTTDFLAKIHHLQSELFQNLSVNTGDLYSAENINNTITAYSPLEYWNNDLNLLLNDDNILKTIQLNGWYSKETMTQPLHNFYLFSNITKLNGLIKSATLIRIVIYYQKNSSVDEILMTNLANIKSKFPQLSVSNGVDDAANPQEKLKLKIIEKSFNILEIPTLSLLLLLLVVYFVFKFKKLKLIKSKMSLFLAFVGQLVTTLFASLTIASVFTTNFEFLQMNLIFVFSIPLIVNIENILTLILSISKFANEASFTTRIQNAINHSFPKSFNFNLLIIFSLLVSSIANSKTSFNFCLFLMVYVVLNFILTYTYFLTIFIVDLNKVELQDLIHINTNSDNDKQQKHGNFNDCQDLQNNEIKKCLVKYLSFDVRIFSAFLFFLLLYSILKWTNGINGDLTYYDDIRNNSNSKILNIFRNKRGFVYELLKITRKDKSLILDISTPIIFSSLTNKYSNLYSHNVIKYQYDINYIFEFVSFLVFSISTIILILQFTLGNEIPKLNLSKNSNSQLKNHSISKLSVNSNGVHSFHSKDLLKGHVLDIVKLCTSSCPFIVSVGIDHNILVWSPLKNPIPAPIKLPISGKFLPVSHVVMSESGSFIAVFSRSGEVKCWSRLSMSWVWSIQLDQLSNDTPLESFFRRRTHVNTGRRKLVSRRSKLSKEVVPESTSELPVTKPKTSKLSSLKKTPAFPDIDANNVLRPNRSMSLDSNFDQSVNIKKLTYNSDMEFIIVLRDGSIFSIDCTTGDSMKSILSNNSIICAKKLLSPRVNDRIVGFQENGELVVATAVNNKWKSRPVKIDSSSYNKGKSLITPAILSQYQDFNHSLSTTVSPSTSPPMSPSMTSVLSTSSPKFDNMVNNQSTKRVDFNDDILHDLKGSIIETVPFVGMVVRACGAKCHLIDVQTGIVLKEWTIGKFKSNSFRVFHPEPSHCRFCGCASVESFSIAYTELETSHLLLHTFSIDNRAKNNICLRVERDARETRCLGFASVTEHQHCLSDVEGWCLTDLNMLMGVRKKTLDFDLLDSPNIKDISPKTDSSGLKVSENLGMKLRKGAGKVATTVPVENSARNTNDTKSLKLSDIWQGWTMSADGNIKYYEIPDGLDSGLLIKKLGPVCKFGHKSIVVSFGNIMKVLYLGNDNLIEEGETNDENASLSSTFQSTSTLSFINRRRKLRIKKYDLTHSTDFDNSNSNAN